MSHPKLEPMQSGFRVHALKDHAIKEKRMKIDQERGWRIGLREMERQTEGRIRGEWRLREALKG